MTAVIAGWRWTVLDASAPNPATDRRRLSQWALRSSSGGLAVFRSSEPRFADTI